MQAAAVLSVLVNAQGVAATNAKLNSVHGNLGKTGAAGAAMGSRLAVGAKVGAAGLLAAGVAAYKLGESFDDAKDTIRVGTGATGKSLKGLQKDFKAVVKDVPTDFGSAGSAIADLNTRLGLTGRPLQKTTKQFLELSRITESDVSTNIKEVTRAFGDWDVATGKQSDTLDYFFRAAQASGATVGDLAQQVVQFGAPLRQVGFSLESSVAMFAQFEKAGVNTQTMMPGLRMALKGFLQDGRDPAKALAQAFDDIRDGSMSSSEALKIFGQRAGADMLEAVRQGRFDLDKFTRSLKGNDETILKAGRDTQDFAEKFQMFRNELAVKFEPIASRVFDTVGDKAEQAFAIINNPKLTADEKLKRLTGMVTDALGDAVDEAGEWGPKIASAVASGFLRWWMDANPLMKVLAGAAIVRMIGGPGALKATGLLIGRHLGGGIAAGAATSAAGGAAAGAAGGLVGGMRGKLMSVAKRGGLIGVGVVLADNLMSEMGRRAEEKSPDIVEAIRAKAGAGKFSTPFGTVDTGKLPGGLHEHEATARKILPLLDQISAKRALLRQADINEIAANAHKLDLNKEQSAQLSRAIGIAQAGRDIGVKVSLDMDLGKLRQFDTNMQRMKAGVFTTTEDIKKITKRNMGIVAQQFGRGTREGHIATAANLRATAQAFSHQMNRSGNHTKEGMARVRRLIERADIIGATKPKARQFAKAWADGMTHGNVLTRKGMDDMTKTMIRKMRLMHPSVRQAAFETWNAQVKEAEKSRKISGEQADRMRSKVLSAFDGLKTGVRRKASSTADGAIENTGRMVNTTARGLEVYRDNVNSALGGFGVTNLNFDIKRWKGSGRQKRQHGGFVVPGEGSGDTYRTSVPDGSFVLNRNATAAFLQKGGMAPVALEPKERVFYPDEVAKIGRRKLEAMNAAVPRFERRQTGGGVGFPGVTGDTDFMPAVGFALSKMARATGQSIFVQDGGRTMAEQQHLYSLYQAGIGNLAAVPSPNAPHIAGRAADITPGRERFGSEAGKFGLGFTVPSESWHIELLNAVGGALGGGALAAPKLKKLLFDGPGGPLQALGQAALDKTLKAGQGYLDKQAGGGGSWGGGPWEKVMTKIAAARGWALGHWRELVMRESGGDPTAVNPTSGAAGLAQALPASKYPPGAWPYTGPASATKQIAWMGDYIAGRYGSPTAALAFHDANNWYQEGGLVQALKNGGQVAYVGDSLGQGTLDAGLAGKLAGVDLRANAAKNRTSAQGVDVLRGLLKKGTDAAVFDLGTNDGSAGLLGQSIASVKKMLGKRALVMSTMLGPDAANKNKKVHAKADSVAEWASVAGRYVGGDPQGLHPNDTGYSSRAGKIAAAVRKTLGKKKGKGNGDKVDPSKIKGANRFETGLMRGEAYARRSPTRKNRKAQRKALGMSLAEMKRMGVPGKRLQRLKELTGDADKFGEFANYANQLGTDDADGNTIPGLFQGKGESHWLNQQLNKLLTLRNTLIKTEKVVHERQMKTATLIAETERRLKLVRKDLARGRKRKAALERQIKQFEKAPKKNKSKLKAARAELGKVQKGLNQDGRVRDMLVGFSKKVTGQRDDLRTARGNILGDSTDPYKGLTAVQGDIGNYASYTGKPVEGMFGGEILTVQTNLRNLNAKINVTGSPDSGSGDSERLSLLEDLLRQTNQRTAVSQSQYKVLNGFNLPGFFGDFAGYFAKGGDISAGMWGIAGETGEAELVRGPATVYSPADTAAILAGSGASRERQIRVVLEDRRTVVYDDGRAVEEIAVDAVNKLARRGGTKLPGGSLL